MKDEQPSNTHDQAIAIIAVLFAFSSGMITGLVIGFIIWNYT